MNVEKVLQERSGSKCELCNAAENLEVYEVQPTKDGNAEECALLCSTCREQIENPDKVDVNHWRCLNDSMWNPTPAIQVLAWRMLDQLRSEGWPQDLLDMLFLEDDTLKWAQALEAEKEDAVIHLDSNGAVLEAGDTVVLIKDLNVKGASFVAKRGTAVRRISLVADNPEHIEGRVDGQHIVILTKFVKKSK